MYKIHQIEASNKSLKMLTSWGMVAIFGLPRTGKTRTALRTAQLYGAGNVLILTKMAAIPGWMSEIDAVQPAFEYTVVNYEKVTKLDVGYDLVIVDESHNLGTRGRPTNRVKDIRALCYNLPAIFLTGTPTIETPLGIYHQWCITKYSPFDRYRNFGMFFKKYGVPDPQRIKGRMIEPYKKHKPSLLPAIEKYAVRINQDDAGIEHKAQDRVHVVKLDVTTKMHLHDLERNSTLGNLMVFDTDIGVRAATHQVEAGAILYDNRLVMLPNTEVVDYLHETFGDTSDVAYFTHFRSTRQKLSEHFVHAKLYSSIAHAEGVDMSHVKHMVVVNTGYSGAKAAQLRERVVNMQRTTEAIVHYIVTDAGISRDVYDAVSQKVDYNLAAFREARRA